MTTIVGALAAIPLLAMALVAPARAEEGSGCDLPPALLATSGSALGAVAHKVEAEHALDIRVIGSGSSTLSGADGAAAAYPARLEWYLTQKLPGVTVHVTTDLHPKQTAEQVAEVIEKTAAGSKSTLVVWQTGTVDALRSVDPDDFRGAVKDGVAAMRAAGSDVVLVNLQYNPRMETVLSVTPYLDNLRVVAQEQDVPLFDRFAMMRYWYDAGDFDLSVTTHSLTLAKAVHDCVGRALAHFVIAAAQIKPSNQRTQQ
jgi:hypothetical protein